MAVVLIRPALRGGWLPYFGRLSTLLAFVVLVELSIVLAGQALGAALLERAAYLPIIVLCLAADGFARTLNNEGLVSALWRAGVTLATLIHLDFSIPGVSGTLLAHPELVLVEIGVLMIVSQFGRFGWLEGLNPQSARTPE